MTILKTIYWKRHKIEFYKLALYSFRIGFSFISIGWRSHVGCDIYKNYFYFRIMGFGFNIFWN